MKKYAVIDIGSLKVKLLIAEGEGDRLSVIHKDSILTCLGKGLNEQKLKVGSKPLADTISAVKRFVRLSKKEGVSLMKIVATEGLRKAKNFGEVLAGIEKETEMMPDIITQHDEADAFFQAVMKDFPKGQKVAVVDMGGGSIQVLVGERGESAEKYFLPLGVYFLQQKFVKNNTEHGKATDEELVQCQNYICGKVHETLEEIKDLSVPLVYGSSNVLDLFKFINLPLCRSCLSPTHPYCTHSDELPLFLEKIKDMTHEERERVYPFQWGYMWGIQMAFFNAYYLARHIGTDVVIPSNINIAEGYILEMMGE